LLISGSNSGTTTLAALTVTGNFLISDGMTIAAPATTNRAGLAITGNGTGDGVDITSGNGATGIGLNILAASTTGHGMLSTGAGSSNLSSAGIRATGGSGGGPGIRAIGGGSGAGIQGVGGATGAGLSFVGGATSGDGILIQTTDGHGINFAPNGTSRHGIFATGGTAGTSDGIKAVAGTGGVDIRGSITGNLSGSVGSVTGLTASNLDTTVSSRMATYTQPTGFLAATFPSGTVANTTNITAGTITTTTNLTNLPSIPANWLTAAGTAADFGTELATAIWTDTVAGDFTVALSVGKSVMNGVSLGTGLTVASVSGSVGSVTGLTASNLDTTISSRMATYTQPTGFLAATFPSGTIANTTNITAGIITTVTNLTNAPTAGDFTATMKTSLNASTPAAITGAVGSVTAGVTLAASQLFAKKNTQLTAFMFKMVLASDHITAATGKTITANRVIDGGAFGACTNAPTEISAGWYKITLSAADMNGTTIALKFTEASCDQRDILIITQA
jgi:hypothetical protein